LDKGEIFPTVEGVPQGGPISPVLANVALHGLENAIVSAFPDRKYSKEMNGRWRPTIVRYADDFVALHPDRTTIEKIKEIANQWLADMGLELKPSKTRSPIPWKTRMEPQALIFWVFKHSPIPGGENPQCRTPQGKLLGFKNHYPPK